VNRTPPRDVTTAYWSREYPSKWVVLTIASETHALRIASAAAATQSSSDTAVAAFSRMRNKRLIE
jgi:hypothetical protein